MAGSFSYRISRLIVKSEWHYCAVLPDGDERTKHMGRVHAKDPSPPSLSSPSYSMTEVFQLDFAILVLECWGRKDRKRAMISRWLTEKNWFFKRQPYLCCVERARALLGFMTIVGTGKGGTEEAQKDSPLRCIVVLGRGSDAIFRILSTAGRCEATLGLFFTT